MIITIVTRGFKKYVFLNKKQMAMRCAPRKYEIKEAIAELRTTGQMPLRNAFYRPDYEGIKTIYAINAAKLLRLENEKKKKNEADGDVNAGAAANNVNNANIMPPVGLVSNLYIEMLKEIIMCDYNPKTDDDLLSLATSVKSRKKMTMLLTKGIEQQDADRFVLDESKLHLLYNPDDDEEEREERKRVALQRIEESNRCIRLYPESEVEQVEKALTQVHDLSILPVNKQIAEVQERCDEVKLGLKIANKVALMESPESGYTYKELTLNLFSEARTKSDQELEPYMQRIVRAIAAVQIHVLTRFFRKTTIRIFPD